VPIAILVGDTFRRESTGAAGVGPTGGAVALGAAVALGGRGANGVDARSPPLEGADVGDRRAVVVTVSGAGVAVAVGGAGGSAPGVPASISNEPAARWKSPRAWSTKPGFPVRWCSSTLLPGPPSSA
jgi:hypothetical protein